MSKHRSSSAKKAAKHSGSPQLQPGEITFVRGEGGVLTGRADITIGRAAQRMDADLARCVKRGDRTLEYQFVQLDHGREDRVSHSLRVRLDPTVTARGQNSNWLSFVETLVGEAPGRSIREIDALFDGLNFEHAKTLTVRALADRMSNFAHYATISFATIDGSEIARLVDPRGASATASLEPVVEITMELSVLTELARFINKVEGRS